MARMQEKDTVFAQDMEGGQFPPAYPDEKGRRSSLRNSFGGVDAKAIEGQVFSMHDIDPALDSKMRLVNNVSDIDS